MKKQVKGLRPIFQKMIDEWPSPIIARDDFGRFSGGTVSSRYLANLDSLGQGIEGGFYIGRKKAYPTEQAAIWLNDRCTDA